MNIAVNHTSNAAMTFCLVLSTASTFGQSPASTEAIPFRAFTLPVIINNESVLTDSFDESCFEGNRKYVKSDKIVLAYDIKECRAKSGSTPTFFLEIADKGKTYLIKDWQTDIKPNERKSLSEIPESNKTRNRDVAVERSSQLWQKSQEELKVKLRASKVLGLTIVQASIKDESEYTEGTGLEISVQNPTEKTIKYLTFNIVGYNAVNDPVRDGNRSGSTISVKGIGPIEPNETGKYKWKYMWYTDSVQSFKIPSIAIQYMDGSTRLLRDVSSATLSRVEYSTLMDTE